MSNKNCYVTGEFLRKYRLKSKQTSTCRLKLFSQLVTVLLSQRPPVNVYSLKLIDRFLTPSLIFFSLACEKFSLYINNWFARNTTIESRTETFLCLWKSEISLKLYFTVPSNRVICLKAHQSIFPARRTNLTKSDWTWLRGVWTKVQQNGKKTDGLGLYAHALFNVTADVPHDLTTNNILYQYVQPWLVQYFNVTAR